MDASCFLVKRPDAHGRVGATSISLINAARALALRARRLLTSRSPSSMSMPRGESVQQRLGAGRKVTSKAGPLAASPPLIGHGALIGAGAR
ncbi:hypothetical protein NDU88_000055 [Pleurodeles waltl]|uniref:Uncharacterized protein n=1 Tax=Pleurodeles waltl TaxID=8319 RepID=A0AAV7NB21_PLEWA|nr:hypothetical protein NDU88_000055 [Pleurodeles waltl]